MENEKKDYRGKALVAFLDLLGFSQEIKENWNNPGNDPLNKILGLKKITPRETNIGLIFNGAPKGGVQYFYRVRSISDSFVVSFPVEEEINGHEINILIGFLNYIAIIWRNCLNIGYTIRGSVTFGDIFWNMDEIIGPAFIDAYHAEQKIVGTSRVLLCSSAVNWIKTINANLKTMWNNELFNLLVKDVDDNIILNPHSLYEPNSDDDKNFVFNTLTMLKDKAPIEVKKKYENILKILSEKNVPLTAEGLKH